MDPRFYTEQSDDFLNVFSTCSEPTTRAKVIELANFAVNELSNIAIAGEPLWKPQNGQYYESMNYVEYLKKYGKHYENILDIVRIAEVGELQYLPSYDEMPLGYVLTPNAPGIPVMNEGSRDVAFVQINPIDFVRLLMDVDQWSKVFHDIVSRAAFLGILSNGKEGGYNGRLQMMTAEFQTPTPFIEARRCIFARYSKQLSPHMWGVVDVSVEKFIPNAAHKFRKKPSGCLIKQMPNGYSKIIWVEHVKGDYTTLNSQFKPFVTSSLAFGATRWLGSLVRRIQCDGTLAAIVASPTNHLNEDDGALAKSNLLQLAGRMTRSFTADISSSSNNKWTHIGTLDSSIDLKVRVKSTLHEFGKPTRSNVIFTTSVWLPFSRKQLFNLLSHHQFRFKWNMVSSQLQIRLHAHLVQGNDVGNRVSLVQVQTDAESHGTFFLQDAYRDKTGASYVVFSSVERFALDNLLNGGNPDHVAIMPSGFTILPDGVPSNGDGDSGGGGCIVTIAYYMNVALSVTPLFIPYTMATMFRKIMQDTLNAINSALFPLVYNGV